MSHKYRVANIFWDFFLFDLNKMKSIKIKSNWIEFVRNIILLFWHTFLDRSTLLDCWDLVQNWFCNSKHERDIDHEVDLDNDNNFDHVLDVDHNNDNEFYHDLDLTEYLKFNWTSEEIKFCSLNFQFAFYFLNKVQHFLNCIFSELYWLYWWWKYLWCLQLSITVEHF